MRFSLSDIRFEGESTWVFPEQRERLTVAKNQIDGVVADKQWNNKKKLANPYEMIASNYKRAGFRVCKRPISRAYFKLWEILMDFRLFPEGGAPGASTGMGGAPGASTGMGGAPGAVRVACLAEGPGGFMEALSDFRGDRDEIWGITLPPTDRKIPGWEKTDGRFNITYGNLYLLPDVLRFAKLAPGAQVVTADGGFDFSINYNEQEAMAQKLIFAEVVTAMTIQAPGGSFVFKVFDIFSSTTMKILGLVRAHYERVSIVKPKVSRPANSEKYIVAQGFNGIQSALLLKLYEMLVRWEDGREMDGMYMSREFIESIREFNERFVGEQIEAIKDTLNLISSEIGRDKFEQMLERQRHFAVEWCEKYGIEYRLG